MILSKYNFTLIIFLFILSCKLGFTQDSARIIYEVRLHFNLENDYNALAEEMLLLTNEVVQGFEFELLINNGKSIFRKTEPMIEDYSQIHLHRLALGYSGGDEIWYTEKDNLEKLIYKNHLESPVLLTLIEEVTWEISNESKRIGKHDAIKATTTRKRGNAVEKIEAWFAPKLQYSYGPLGYNGLPGLILEMKNDRIVYKFKKLVDTPVIIEPPRAPSQMTLESYYQMLESRMAEIKSGG